MKIKNHQIKRIINSLKKDYSFRKKFILIGSIAIIGIIGLIFLGKSLNTNFSANVLQLQTRKTKTLDTCSDTDGGKNHEVFGRIYTVINGYTREEADTCNSDGTLREWFCGNPGEAAGLLRSENYVDCNQGCAMGMCRNCTNPEGILACSLGLSTCDALCMLPAEYGYGYGYNRTGDTYGYGYGYGYKKLDKSGKPWMYLLTPFKTYTRKIYDAVISKLGFQMVKSYNKKEFTVPTTR